MNRTQQNILALVAALLAEVAVQMVYRDNDGVISIRNVQPKSIEKCASGSTIVRCFDLNRDAPRSFTLAGVLAVL